jgi:hypothetical protein
VEVVEEPVAAALAYAHAGLKVGERVLVYDLGGGTFDLALLARQGETFRPALEPRGLRRCGGDDFDLALYDHCDGQARKTLGRPVSPDGGLNLQFLRLCRLRKETLSARDRCEVSAYLPGGVRFKQTLDRATFEGLIRPRVESTVRLTRTLLDDAAARGSAVDTVVLIGGSARVPLVQGLLEEALPLEPRAWQQQDVAVALGAAWAANDRWGSPVPAKGRPPRLPERVEPALPAALCQELILEQFTGPRPDEGAPVREAREPVPAKGRPPSLLDLVEQALPGRATRPPDPPPPPGSRGDGRGDADILRQLKRLLG